jgi:hypothetical protein
MFYESDIIDDYDYYLDFLTEEETQLDHLYFYLDHSDNDLYKYYYNLDDLDDILIL